MKVFRFSKAKYCFDLSGIGASFYPGRWNRSGRKIIYSAGSRALALVEITVHLPSGIIPKDYFLIDLLIPDDSIKIITLSDLPTNWKSKDDITKDIGDSFIAENKYLVLSVPSVIVPFEQNYLINPNHIKMQEVAIISSAIFDIDPRLYGF